MSHAMKTYNGVEVELHVLTSEHHRDPGLNPKAVHGISVVDKMTLEETSPGTCVLPSQYHSTSASSIIHSLSPTKIPITATGSVVKNTQQNCTTNERTSQNLCYAYTGTPTAGWCPGGKKFPPPPQPPQGRPRYKSLH
jgi:hypothetical protein